MNAKEFRIGNKVQFYKSMIQEIQYGHIDGILFNEYWNEYEYVIPEYSRSAYLLIQGFQPIPLTDEWLLKFGFIEFEAEYFKKDNFKIVKSFDNYWLDGFGTELKYVHQLQNLYFALTGIEL